SSPPPQAPTVASGSNAAKPAPNKLNLRIEVLSVFTACILLLTAFQHYRFGQQFAIREQKHRSRKSDLNCPGGFRLSGRNLQLHFGNFTGRTEGRKNLGAPPPGSPWGGCACLRRARRARAKSPEPCVSAGRDHRPVQRGARVGRGASCARAA